ncbi:MAG: hypothetical protein HYY98_17130 [Burkholderiales bacterium]|nr:hypothetical protein [Burkholderiales bacterium]
MIPVLYTHAAAAAIAAALAFGATWQVQAWRWAAADGQRIEQEQIAQAARETDARQQRHFADHAAAQHAQQLATINTQLGDAHAHIAQLSGRACFGAGTVRMLNGIGASGLGVRAPAANPAGAPPAPAAPAPDDAYASERDTAEHIALCRASYAAVSDQLNRILDIEDERERRRAATSR